MNVSLSALEPRTRLQCWPVCCADRVVDRLRASKQYEALQVQLDEAELENTGYAWRQDAEISGGVEGRLSRLTGENDALADEANMLGTELQRLRDEVSHLTDLNGPDKPKLRPIGRHC